MGGELKGGKGGETVLEMCRMGEKITCDLIASVLSCISSLSVFSVPGATCVHLLHKVLSLRRFAFIIFHSSVINSYY